MHFLKKIFFRFPGHYAAALIIAAVVGAFRFSTLPDGINAQFVWYEVFSVSGFVTFLIGALMTVSYFGAFDLFSFAFSSGRTGEHRKYKDYVDYSNQKAQKRAKGGYYFVPYYVVGVLVILISRFFA